MLHNFNWPLRTSSSPSSYYIKCNIVCQWKIFKSIILNFTHTHYTTNPSLDISKMYLTKISYTSAQLKCYSKEYLFLFITILFLSSIYTTQWILSGKSEQTEVLISGMITFVSWSIIAERTAVQHCQHSQILLVDLWQPE